jgi:hypothetical protein
MGNQAAIRNCHGGHGFLKTTGKNHLQMWHIPLCQITRL